jgi:hypothetical protein
MLVQTTKGLYGNSPVMVYQKYGYRVASTNWLKARKFVPLLGNM